MTIFQLGRLDVLNRTLAIDRRNKRPVMEYMSNFYFDLDVHSIALVHNIAAMRSIATLSAPAKAWVVPDQLTCNAQRF